MRTDELIAAVAADTLPRATVRQRLVRALPLAFALSLAGFLLWRGLRPDLAQALTSAAALKTVLPLVLAGLAVALALGLARPEARPRGRRLALGALGAAVLAGFAVALAAGGLAGLVSALFVPSLVTCLTTIPALALPLLGAALWALAAGAPLDPARTGAVAGLAAGGLATALYSFYCSQDAPLFFLPAYGLAILLVAAAGALIGARALRW